MTSTLIGRVAMAVCTDITELAAADPAPLTPEGCQECLASGGSWLHLRRCINCGHIGCCDSSPNKHATAHFRTTTHPVVQSFQPGENWRWCYLHEVGA